MPIQFLEQQKRLRQLGEIRLGDQVVAGKGKRPNKLKSWRLTSPDRNLLEAAAVLLGGTVEAWTDAPANARSKWELYTESSELSVAIPPLSPGAETDSVFSQWMEQWNGGGCVRRCDGVSDVLNGFPCACPVDDVDAMKAGRDSKATVKTCVMTTRLNVLVFDLPDLGVWKLETHGYYAAVELGPAVNALIMANQSGQPQAAKLRIEARTSQGKQGEQRKDYIVPVLSLPSLTLGTVLNIGPRRSMVAVEAVQAPLAAIGDGTPKSEAPTGVDPFTGEHLKPGDGMVSQAWIRGWHAQTKELTDDEKHMLIGRGTNGRVTSSKQVWRSETSSIKAAVAAYALEQAGLQQPLADAVEIEPVKEPTFIGADGIEYSDEPF